MEKVSAIIITHNRVDLLKKALRGVQNQTYPDIECIIIDDASTDQTELFCRSLKNITYIRIKPEESKGANYARNIGLREAHGKFVAFCDDDDEWLPEKTSKQVQLLEQSEDVGLVYCGRILCYFTPTSNHEELERLSYLNKGDLNRRILYIIPCVTSTILCRKDLLTQIGGFDENLKYWQEYELSIRLCQLTNIDFVNEHLVKYRIDVLTTNRMSNKYKQWLDTPRYIYLKHKALYAKLSVFERWMYRRMYYNDAYVRSILASDSFCVRRNRIMKDLYAVLTLPFRAFKRLTLH